MSPLLGFIKAAAMLHHSRSLYLCLTLAVSFGATESELWWLRPFVVGVAAASSSGGRRQTGWGNRGYDSVAPSSHKNTIYSSFCLSCFISLPWHPKCSHFTVQGLLTPSEGGSCSDRVNNSPHESSSALNAMGGTERWSEIFIHSRPESTSAKATTTVWMYSSTEHSASAHTIFSRGGKMPWLSWFIL